MAQSRRIVMQPRPMPGPRRRDLGPKERPARDPIRMAILVALESAPVPLTSLDLFFAAHPGIPQGSSDLLSAFREALEGLVLEGLVECRCWRRNTTGPLVGHYQRPTHREDPCPRP